MIDMTAIQEAISYFEALLERLGNGDADNLVCATALAALRECAERREGCEYCETPGKTLHVVECAEPRIMLHVSGRYVQMYDEEYPGWVDNFQIRYCPMCGRKLERSDT